MSDINTKDKPACFNDAQWREWSKCASWCKPQSIDWACTDCTPEFQTEMKLQERCSWPCVQFVKFPDGGIEGKRISIMSFEERCKRAEAVLVKAK